MLQLTPFAAAMIGLLMLVFVFLVPAGLLSKLSEMQADFQSYKSATVRRDREIISMLDRIELTVSVVPADQPNCRSCDLVMKFMDTDNFKSLRNEILATSKQEVSG